MIRDQNDDPDNFHDEFDEDEFRSEGGCMNWIVIMSAVWFAGFCLWEMMHQ